MMHVWNSLVRFMTANPTLCISLTRDGAMYTCKIEDRAMHSRRAQVALSMEEAVGKAMLAWSERETEGQEF